MNITGFSFPAPVKVTGFLSLFFSMQIVYLSTIMFDFLPSGGEETRLLIYLLNSFGILLGSLLCPLFLPVPSLCSNSGSVLGAEKRTPKLGASFVFIVLMVLPNLFIRFRGLEFWINSRAVQTVMALNSGMFPPLCYGVFFLTRDSGSENRGGRLGVFCLALTLMIPVTIRQYAMPLLEWAGIAVDPQYAMSFMWNIIKWNVIVMGLCASLSVALLRQKDGRISYKSAPTAAGTDKTLILRLAALALVFSVLTALLKKWLYPWATGVQDTYNYNFPVTVVSVLLLTLVSRKHGFLRRFLFPVMILFIMFPCLAILNNVPWLVFIMGTMIQIVFFAIWIIFTDVVVEQYIANVCLRGRFWFYGCTALVYAIFFSSFFFGRLAGSLIPFTVQGVTLVSAVSAVLFVLLAIRLLYPERASVAEQVTPHSAAVVSYAEIFKERNLTSRETEIARLMVEEGLGNNQIAERIFRSTATVELHITSIYRKFNVQSRAEFMAIFVTKQRAESK